MQTMQGGKTLHTLDSILAKTGLTAKDLLSAFAGDLLIACIDNGKAPDPPTDSLGKPRLGKPDLFVVFTINDLAAYNRIATTLKDSLRKPSADSSKSPFRKMHFAHTLRDNIYVLGPDQNATDAYFDEAGRGGSRLVSDAVSDNPFAVAIDLKALTAFLRPVLSASPKSQQAVSILELFDQLTLATGRVQGNTMESYVELRMTDQQQNSLKTLIQLVTPGH
jgi:hypothetical protein